MILKIFYDPAYFICIKGINKVSNYKKYSEQVQFGFLFMALLNNKQQKEIGQLLS